jgi:hypothetical protein
MPQCNKTSRYHESYMPNMKATEAKFLRILSSVSQFIILIHQSTNSLTPKEC